MNIRSLESVVFALAALVALAGCNQQERDSTVSNEVTQTAAHAGKAISDSAAKAKVELTNDGISAKVKESLLTANNLNTGDLRVDTDGKVVVLHGTVPTNLEKSRAETIAKGQVGPNYKVINQLAVKPL